MCWCVQSLVTLEQGGSISLSSLEAQLETLLESVVTFNPPGAFSSLSSSATLSTVSNKPFYHLDCTSFFLCRDGFGAEAHGILRPVQRCSGSAEWSRCLNRRGTRCSCHYLAGQEGEGLSYSASSHGLLPLSCISTAHDAHHGGMHHSILQPR